MDAIDEQISVLGKGHLPKWPQMIVTGESITPDQAFDIIFRTDDFLTDASEHSGGNNREFGNWYRKSAGLDALQVERKYPEGHTYMDQDWDRREQLHAAIGFVSTEYVSNDWSACCFIYGPHGWCHPDGQIQYVDNVGKWPKEREIYDEWTTIASAWPFLDLHVTLMSGESCEDDTEPLINFRVVNGTVEVCRPDLTVHNKIASRSSDDMFAALSQGRENGLPNSWYTRAAAIVKEKIASLPVDAENT